VATAPVLQGLRLEGEADRLGHLHVGPIKHQMVVPANTGRLRLGARPVRCGTIWPTHRPTGVLGDEGMIHG
jgi:hypothetical protein